jgi:hypothetical protein
MINGGLGNQLFQYIFYRFLEEITGDECILCDDEFAASEYHNGYEIERIFGLKAKRLSEIMPPDEWERLLELSHKTKTKTVPEILSEKAPLTVVQEGLLFSEYASSFTNRFNGKIFGAEANSYTPQVGTVEGNVYYFGYWINAFWFYYIRDLILKDLTFPPFTDDFNINMHTRIRHANSVAVHMRRGDFISYGRLIDISYHQISIEEMRCKVKDPTFFVFSDDIQWCRENFLTMGFNINDNIVYVDGNSGLNNYKDMQLMSYCQNMIIVNSSFSYLASLLNQNPNKYIINPTTRDII